MSTETPRARPRWLAPAGLIALSAVPVIAGAARLTELGGGGPVTARNARFFAAPLPLVLHIVGASAFCVLGALQFAPRLRGRGWHRAAGRWLVPCGLVAALSGLWMTLSYQIPDSVVLAAARLVFGSAMAVCLVLGVVAIRRRDVIRHRAWMTRGYAIGLGAGTQVLTLLPLSVVTETPDELSRALLATAGWVINLAVAEWIIRKPLRVKETR
ncbi:DUF2306 domain-containing protein [Kibdelosporangium persicum]|uniref:Membrane protein (DUF2306) n=1 Tax=Kibdelosporangium persicum TaxID=2698649 RepID=A0ABX2F7T8_9PSEU|nr:DUF2306 domain-containing protein [Kibdelosporangium persicum]NRN66870.1 putative membrane protein (DUF2306) [Kibdelosporangium persicum]